MKKIFENKKIVLQSPLFWAFVAFGVSVLLSFDINQIRLWAEIVSIIVVSIFYYLDSKTLITKRFALKFSIYFTLVFFVKYFVLLCLSASNTLELAINLLNFQFIFLGIFIKSILRFIYSFILTSIMSKILKPGKKIVKISILLSIAILFGLIKTYLDLPYKTLNHYQIIQKAIQKDYYKKHNIVTEPYGEIVIPRSHENIIALNNGKVLIMGGEDRVTSAFIHKCELFDTQTKKSTLTKRDLPIGFDSFIAVLLQNNKVLLTGGRDWDGNNLRRTLVFNSLTEELSNGPEMNLARSGNASILLKNGKVLILGGTKKCQPYAELYDLKLNKFVKTPPLPYTKTGRYYSSIMLKDGHVLIVGASSCYSKLGNYPIASEIYDPKLNKFYPTGNLVIGRSSPELFTLNDGRVVVFGGAYDGSDNKIVEIYDPKKGTFSVVGRLPDDFYASPSITLPNDKILFIGGTKGYAVGAKDLKDIWEYNPNTNKLKNLGTMIIPRSNLTAILQKNKKRIVIFGGTKQKLVEVYKYE